ALARPQDSQRGNGGGHDEGGGGDRQHRHAEHHEQAPPDAINPGAHQGLAEDAGGAVHALDEADVGLVASEPMDVQRQQDEAVQAPEEEEIGQHGPHERLADQDVEGRLTSSVPIDTALALEGHPDDGAIRLTVLQDGQTLASGAILALAPGEREATAAWASADEGWPLPMSELCLACGRLNPLGLRA